MSNNVPQNYEKLPEKEYFKGVEMVFQAFDKDKDNHLNKNEFTALVGNISGSISFPITEKLIDYMFKICDSKKDGLIDLQELYSAAYHYYYKK